MNDADPIVAGVELGGTKTIAVISRGREILDRARWPTRGPGDTLRTVSRWLDAKTEQSPVAAIGIASFGPLDLETSSPTFGRIRQTPKAGWSGVDVLAALSADRAVPIGFDTDVAGAALAEGRWGAAVGADVHIYLTIGTGVGAGVVVAGKPVHGLVHPEIGHVRLRRAVHDAFPGLCPFHGDCIEGLVSGPAITARAGEAVDGLVGSDPLWDAVASDLSELMVVLILMVSPQRIVIGGGVAERRPLLFPRIHSRTAELLGGYLPGQLAHQLQQLIVPPRLGADAGPLGAVALALDAVRKT